MHMKKIECRVPEKPDMDFKIFALNNWKVEFLLIKTGTRGVGLLEVGVRYLVSGVFTGLSIPTVKADGLDSKFGENVKTCPSLSILLCVIHTFSPQCHCFGIVSTI